MAHIVIMGAGIGGMAMAYEMRAKAGKADVVTVVSNTPKFHFVPSNPWVAVNWRKRDEVELEIEPLKRLVRVRGQALDFTALEFDLLLHFAQHPGHVYSRSQLLSAVWGYSHDGYEHTVTTHINRLRAKLEADPLEPQFILTVRGAGYKMRERPSANT